MPFPRRIVQCEKCGDCGPASEYHSGPIDCRCTIKPLDGGIRPMERKSLELTREVIKRTFESPLLRAIIWGEPK